MDLVTSGEVRKLADGGGFRMGVSDMSISSLDIEEYTYEEPSKAKG